MSKNLSNVLRGTNSPLYTLPTANTTTLGGVKVDGTTITANNGIISSSTYTLPTANNTVLGGVKVDGTTITSNNGIISSSTYTLPVANTTTLGGVKVDGTTITANNGIISGITSATKTITNISAAYTVVAGDLGKIINCTTGTFTVSLTAAATLGTGFTCTIQNTGTNNLITVDPDASETINGYTTWAISPSQSITLTCDGSNFILTSSPPTLYSEKVFAGLYTRPTATGSEGVALGSSAVSSGAASFSYRGTASALHAMAIGSGTAASANYTVAFGYNAQAVTGAGAMALGNSYASGADSFAAVITNNTSSYGAIGASSIAMGPLAKASGTSYSMAFGWNSQATGNVSTAFGIFAVASGGDSLAVGRQSQATQDGCSALGVGAIATGYNASALGSYGTASGSYSLVIQGGLASATNSAAIGSNSLNKYSQAVTGAGAMALGGSYASGIDSFAAATANNTSSFGALGNNSIAIGKLAKASGANSVAIGSGSAGVGAVSAGSGSIALGYSYASGQDSFAAAISNNTTTYGAKGLYTIALGYRANAGGTGTVAIGQGATSAQDGALVLGYNASSASQYSFVIGPNTINSNSYGAGAIGTSCNITGNYSIGIGYFAYATASLSMAFGTFAKTSQQGKYAFGCPGSAQVGSAQSGKIILVARTIAANVEILTSNAITANTDNQFIIATNQAMTFTGMLIAKQTASANISSYIFKGAAVNNGGTVSISSISVETIADTIVLDVQPTFTANSSVSKALTVTSGSKANTDIYWLCNIDSVEVTYA